MAYTAFNKDKPIWGADDGTTTMQHTRNNLTAMRDAVITGAFLGWGYTSANANFTASISGTTMTVSAISQGYIIVGAGIYNGAAYLGKVVSQTSGTQFGVGTYTLDITGTLGSTSGLTAPAIDPSQPHGYRYQNSTTDERIICVLTWDANGNCTSQEVWYASGHPTVVAPDRIGKETFTYDANFNVTGSSWS